MFGCGAKLFNVLPLQMRETKNPNAFKIMSKDWIKAKYTNTNQYRYAVPEDWYTSHKVRRYGFHGTSHKYVANEASKILDKPLENLDLITAHLGHGCSIAAIKNGKSLDTSMGFSPLEGLMMGSRSGDIDPNVINYMLKVSKFQKQMLFFSIAPQKRNETIF